MNTKYRVVVLLMYVFASACSSGDKLDTDKQTSKPSNFDKDKVLAYFVGTRAGVPICKLERDLGLEAAIDREAPTLTPYNALWRIKYNANGLVVSFAALDLSAEGDGSKLVYAGDPYVMTRAEYYETLRQMGIR